jgi:hypothetical protein
VDGRTAGEFSNNPSTGQNQDAIAMVNNLLDFAARPDHSATIPGDLPYGLKDLRFCPDVYSAGRFIEDKTSERAAKQTSKNQLLLITA